MFGSKNTITDTTPCFFKLFLDGFNMTEHLCIPPQFKKHVLEELRNNSVACLKGPSGRIWHALVVKTENKILLKEGWQQFARDNSLGNNEFMIFTYDGNLCFNVRIFDVNGMERANIPDHREYHPVSPQTDTAGPSQFHQPRDFVGSRNEVPLDKKGEKKPTETKFTRENDTAHIPETSKKKPNLTNKFVKYFTSKFPYFQLHLKSYNVSKQYTLHIPNSFSKKYFPGRKTMVLLRNWEEKTWEVNVLAYGYNGSNVGFYGGWVDFVRDNDLKENDVCIFELVGEKEMKVHKFRPGPYTYT